MSTLFECLYFLSDIINVKEIKIMIRVDESMNNKIGTIQKEYGLDSKSQAIRKAIEITTVHNPQIQEKEDLKNLTTHIKALETKIEKLEWMITKLDK